ncbi:MAG: polysaccharide biosynthesis protein [Ginsengibacter sp.]
MIEAITSRIQIFDYTKLRQWSKLISVTGFTQALIQIVGLVCGIMVIRVLPPSEYALYTLANTMLGTMIVLADGGIATAAMSQGAKVWKESDKLGSVIVAGLRLRKIFAGISLPISLGILLFLLIHHGASWLLAFLILLSIVPTFYMLLHAGILEISPKLQQDIIQLQRIKVVTNIGRFLILSITIFTFPFAVIGLLAVSIPQIWANSRYKKISSKYADLNQEIDPVIQKNILKMVWRLLPEAIYYCLSGQIAIWLISVFGSTNGVAQAGALSRLSIVLGFFSILFANLVAPRFARLPNLSKLLLVRYLQIQLALVVLCTAITGMVWLFSNQILWVLGGHYKGLNTELVLMVVGSCLNLLYGASFLLGTYRSWIINPVVFISISVISTITAIFALDVSSLKSIIILNIAVTSIEFLMLSIFNILKILRVNDSDICD